MKPMPLNCMSFLRHAGTAVGLGLIFIFAFVLFYPDALEQPPEEEIQPEIIEEPEVEIPLPEKSEFIFDVVYPGFHDVHLQKIQELGVNHLTMFLCWSQAEPQNDNFNFRLADQRLRKYTELGMPPKAIVIDWWNCKPEWLEYDEPDDNFVEELEEFTEIAAQKYGSEVEYWMIGNEMNGFYWVNPNISEGHVELYKRVSAAAKKENPNINVGTRLAFD